MKPTERLKLLVAYDGRPFRGWQSQATNDAVQDFVEAAFKKIVGERVVVQGSGRTDAGVHALGQVAHATVPKGHLLLAKWLAALNANLPPEIRIMRVQRAADDFHSRFHAKGKRYTYRIYNGPCMHPLEIGRAWYLPGRLDLDVLRAGAKLLAGRHDFAAFAANRGKPDPDTVRTIHRIVVTGRSPLVTLHFEGDGFLYKMVRLLTGTLVRCAQGRDPLSIIEGFLAHPLRKKTQFAAPAEGLYLAKVLY